MSETTSTAPEGSATTNRPDPASGKTVPAAAPGGVVYGLGLIGAAVYYIQAATTFLGGVVGVLKALVWPAFLVYEALRFLAA